MQAWVFWGPQIFERRKVVFKNNFKNGLRTKMEGLKRIEFIGCKFGRLFMNVPDDLM